MTVPPAIRTKLRVSRSFTVRAPAGSDLRDARRQVRRVITRGERDRQGAKAEEWRRVVANHGRGIARVGGRRAGKEQNQRRVSRRDTGVRRALGHCVHRTANHRRRRVLERHSMKGAAFEAARRLEQDARNGDLIGLVWRREEIELELSRVCADLETFRRESSL